MRRSGNGEGWRTVPNISLSTMATVAHRARVCLLPSHRTMARRALLGLVALSGVSAALGIYPDAHFDHVTKLTTANFDSVVKAEVDAGRTFFVRWIASAGAFVRLFLRIHPVRRDTPADTHAIAALLARRPNVPARVCKTMCRRHKIHIVSPWDSARYRTPLRAFPPSPRNGGKTTSA